MGENEKEVYTQHTSSSRLPRVYYQANILINFNKSDHPPSPVDHGWTLENGKCQPLRYTKVLLPERFKTSVITDTGQRDDDDDSASNTSSFSDYDSDQEDEVPEEENENDFE